MKTIICPKKEIICYQNIVGDELEPEDYFIKDKPVPHENLKVAIGMLILAIYTFLLWKALGGF
ncbi:hypothetical protein J2755_000263 [Methanohalophilus levihalophilus]|uniref:hypothetical protein n=1 Tax=Methanohalophilus levihalophilus TaxID=1431282 RepID=UPI001AEB8118|nr:hypothetical protein [Methanohalophilus levihalophilus]MBP2029343.1 hypothetical protein [Methanohalophilus levihalophilus]